MTISDPREHWPLPDPLHNTCLARLGRRHWHAALLVDYHGHVWPWLVDVDIEPDDDEDPTGCCCASCAPHEQDGRLPLAFRVKLNQCQAIGRTTKRRCRHPAPIGERYCKVHRDALSTKDGA